ncbi:MAG: DUF2141 domain-containing protein [Myxococcaceae bacterium]|nr:DUF2141 domain-containing protein [Myxococcaceae bacterium]
MRTSWWLAVALWGTRALAQDGGVAACAIDVEVSGARDGGVVWVMLFSDAQAASYPSKRANALARNDVVPSSGLVRTSFDQLECRDYAVSVVHDENGNGKLDRGLLGIPKEGTGASRNAKRLFGPPRFDEAKVPVRAGRTRVQLKLSY